MASVELDIHTHESEASSNNERILSSVDSQTHSRSLDALPPADGGYQAWLCLAGCFMANVLIWGFAFSYGILQEYYSTHEPFAAHPGGIPAVGTTATGLMYLSLPIYFSVFQRWPQLRKYSLWLSLPLAAAALIGASFSNTVPQLIFCQGVLYSLAGNALVSPTITYLDEWFVRRKGLAVGIMWAGDGAGGALMPPLMEALLSRFGFRWTLRAIAGIILIVTAPMLVFLKPRLPISATHRPRPMNFSFMRSPVFWVLQVFNITQGMGYFLPSNYLPSYVESLGLSRTFGSLSLLMTNLAAVMGCVCVGALVDRFDVTNIILGISLLAGLAILGVWGLSASIAPICIFCLAYGLTAGAYSTSWGGMVKDVQRKYTGADTSILFGLFAAGRGIGAIVSGPLSEVLLRSTGDTSRPGKFAYGSEYGSIVIFSGCTMLAGGFSWLFRRTGLI